MHNVGSIAFNVSWQLFQRQIVADGTQNTQASSLLRWHVSLNVGSHGDKINVCTSMSVSQITINFYND